MYQVLWEVSCWHKNVDSEFLNFDPNSPFCSNNNILYNVCSVHRGDNLSTSGDILSTSGNVQYIGGIS